MRISNIIGHSYQDVITGDYVSKDLNAPTFTHEVNRNGLGNGRGKFNKDRLSGSPSTSYEAMQYQEGSTVATSVYCKKSSHTTS